MFELKVYPCYDGHKLETSVIENTFKNRDDAVKYVMCFDESAIDIDKYEKSEEFAKTGEYPYPAFLYRIRMIQSE